VSGAGDASPFAKDDVSVLSRAIDCAQKALKLAPNLETERVRFLLNDIGAAYCRPCEGDRVIDDHTMLFARAVQLADQSLQQHDQGKAQRYGRVITALLPDIQDDLLRAMQIRNSTRPTP
jgi:hypothetical protein